MMSSLILWPIKPPAPNPATALQLNLVHHNRRVGEADRWPDPDFALEMAVFPACR